MGATRPPEHRGGRRSFVHCTFIRAIVLNAVRKVQSRAMNHVHAIRSFGGAMSSRGRLRALRSASSSERSREASYLVLTVRRVEVPESASATISSRQNVEALAMPAVA